ncbi:MAG: MOSC N-terminal beta barrel domain-containing protein, partial [Solirubrobacteraceae bacterium]
MHDALYDPDRRRPDSEAARRTATVTALLTTPVKGLRIGHVDEIVLGASGASDDRRFFLIDEQDRMVNGKRAATLGAVSAAWERHTRVLTLGFPDGATVSGPVRLGEQLTTRFHRRSMAAFAVTGPWSDALSRHAGLRLRLVQADPAQGATDRGPRGAVSLISSASVRRLEAAARGQQVDPRRFRMLVEVDGPDAHGEDRWV